MRNWLMNPVVKMAALIMTLPEASAQQSDCDDSLYLDTLRKSGPLGLTLAGLFIAVGGAIGVSNDLWEHRPPRVTPMLCTIFGSASAIVGMTLLKDYIENPPVSHCLS